MQSDAVNSNVEKKLVTPPAGKVKKGLSGGSFYSLIIGMLIVGFIGGGIGFIGYTKYNTRQRSGARFGITIPVIRFTNSRNTDESEVRVGTVWGSEFGVTEGVFLSSSLNSG